MRDDDGPGPLTHASASGAAICRRISGAGHWLIPGVSCLADSRLKGVRLDLTQQQHGR
jgi:hypothetical protein